MQMDPSIKKYAVLPKSCIDLWVDSVGISKLPDDVCGVLAEDATYRIREAVHNALRIMKHCKRTYLTVDDFNSGLKESNTEPIYGHSGIENISFKSVSYKDGRVCYIDDKEVNLREIALEPVYPTDPGDVTVKASWLVLEGQVCSAGKSKDECKSKLSEPLSTYLTNITSALIDKSDNLRKVACKDLLENKKLQIVMPYLVTFFSSQIKQHTGKETFSIISSYILLAVNSLVDNSSLLLAPYVVQLVKIMLYIAIEAQIPVSKWWIKDQAAYVLSHLCRKQKSTLSSLPSQLLKAYQDNLKNNTQPSCCLYGAVVGTKILGYEAVCRVLHPLLSEKIKTVQELIEKAESTNDMLEGITIRSALADAGAMLLSNRSSVFLIKSINYSEFYDEMYDEFGEEIICRCTRFQHEYNTGCNKTNSNLKSQMPLKRSQSVTMELINKELEKLKHELPMETAAKESVTTHCNIGEVVSTYSWKRSKIDNFVHTIFVNKGDEEAVPTKRRKLDGRRKFGASSISCRHNSYSRQTTRNIVKELSNISCSLPNL